MPADSLHTTQLHICLDRWRAGDLRGRDELLDVTASRLLQLTRRMLRTFPNVAHWQQTDDVFQNTVLRLLRSLEAVRPETTRDFYNFAAVHIRRELLDLARHYAKRIPAVGVGAASPSQHDPADPTADDGLDRYFDLEKWQRFHEEVDRLPAEEREVVGLRFYHGWSQSEIADLFQVDERTVRRRWAKAMDRLLETIGD